MIALCKTVYTDGLPSLFALCVTPASSISVFIAE